MHFVSYAQNREDVVLFRALHEVPRGFYVDVGAHDPELDSVTKAFYDRGWRGINIEPSPYWHARLVLTRTNDINLQIAVSNQAGESVLHELGDTGLSTLDREIAHRHRDAQGLEIVERKVATRTLAQVLDAHAMGEIHFLKIDVEGREREVLEGIDFDCVRPWIVLVEAIDPVDHRPTHLAWEALLLDRGYAFALFDGLNRFYFDRSRPELGTRLAAPASVLDNFVSAQVLSIQPRFPEGFGINFFGQLTSATGQGVAARHAARALRRAGIPLACVDLRPYYPSQEVSEELEEIKGCLSDAAQTPPYPINLYCISAIDLPALTEQIAARYGRTPFHAAIIWWETTQVHPDWADAMARMDALVTCSGFLTNVLANRLPLTPVLTGKQPLFVDTDVRAARAEFGLPEHATVFIASFDPSSDPARKNPAGVIAAFRHAFAAGDADVRLVFHLNNAGATHMASETQRLLMDAAQGDARIGFALEPMRYRRVLALYASADVYVSLHRAEGLGLGMLEAMRLGVPVIATAWSGNMAFMDQRTACLVRYRLTQALGNHPFYRPEAIGTDARWAEPVLEDAAAWMQFLHRNPVARRQIGEAGRARAERYQRDALQLAWVQELAHLWQLRAILPAVQEKFSTKGSAQ